MNSARHFVRSCVGKTLFGGNTYSGSARVSKRYFAFSQPHLATTRYAAPTKETHSAPRSLTSNRPRSRNAVVVTN